MNIGFFGGSFDPIHNGHISMIKGALEGGLLDAVVVIPVARSNFKRGKASSPAPYRFYMAKEVIDSLKLKNVIVSDVEFLMEGISYTANTLEKVTHGDFISDLFEANHLKHKGNPKDNKYFWIMGSDCLKEFPKWREPEKILSYATLLAANRPGDTSDYHGNIDDIKKRYGSNVLQFNISGIDVSSSGIKLTNDFNDVPEVAKSFIEKHQLYKSVEILNYASEDAVKKFYDYAIDMFQGMSQNRLLHTLNVGLLSAKLAHIFGVDVDKALIAGTLHDCAKEIDIEEQRRLANIVAGDLFDAKKLLHSPAGSYLAKHKYGIEDEEILNAITYHTTGRGDMTMLDKIVFLADKIEPSRTYTDLSLMRELAMTNLDASLSLCVKAVKDKFKSQGRDVHPLTEAMIQSLGL